MIKFPEDFKVQPHSVVPNAMRAVFPKEGKAVISIVGGGRGLYGNGITTFEMWDFREEQPKGYLSVEEINLHLEQNPIV